MSSNVVNSTCIHVYIHGARSAAGQKSNAWVPDPFLPYLRKCATMVELTTPLLMGLPWATSELLILPRAPRPRDLGHSPSPYSATPPMLQHAPPSWDTVPYLGGIVPSGVAPGLAPPPSRDGSQTSEAYKQLTAATMHLFTRAAFPPAPSPRWRTTVTQRLHVYIHACMHACMHTYIHTRARPSHDVQVSFVQALFDLSLVD